MTPKPDQHSEDIPGICRSSSYLTNKNVKINANLALGNFLGFPSPSAQDLLATVTNHFHAIC